MRALSDFKGEEAIDLWADLLDPIVKILQDNDIKNVYRTGTRMELVKEILKKYKADTVYILERIDDTPVNGINVIMRGLQLIADVENSDDIKDFFGSAGQATAESVSSGSVMENIGVIEEA